MSLLTLEFFFCERRCLTDIRNGPSHGSKSESAAWVVGLFFDVKYHSQKTHPEVPVAYWDHGHINIVRLTALGWSIEVKQAVGKLSLQGSGERRF